MAHGGGLTELVATIENLSEAGSFEQLLAHLQNQEEMLIQHLPQLDDVLPVLRPVQHSLGMIFILCACSIARAQSGPERWLLPSPLLSPA